jgi:hypothetical protein
LHSLAPFGRFAKAADEKAAGVTRRRKREGKGGAGQKLVFGDVLNAKCVIKNLTYHD